MKITIRIWLLSALLLCNCAIADEQTAVIKKYSLPSLQQRAQAAQLRLYANEKPSKIVLPSLKPQVEEAKQQRDLDNPLFTGRVDYDLTENTDEIAALHTQYEPEFDEAWNWWTKLIVPEYLPANPQLALSAYIGKNDQDDLIGARYLAKDLQLQVIDGRSITIVVSPLDESKYLVPDFEIRRPSASSISNLPRGFHFDENWELVRDTRQPLTDELAAKYTALSEQEKCEQFVHAVARELLRFDYNKEGELVNTRLETRHYSTQQGGYGVFAIDLPWRVRWFPDGSISWWSDGKTVVLDVRKLLEPPSSKMGIYASRNVAREYAFGLLPGDKQTFERFSTNSTPDFFAMLRDLYLDERIEKYRAQKRADTAYRQSIERPKQP